MESYMLNKDEGEKLIKQKEDKLKEETARKVLLELENKKNP